ncbi:cobyrinate a,c-diamide synthase [Crocosphaera watsonii]|uniref:Cobyrinate a,c-diamide synthase n=1 Tax=Crocosphaera watsonii WH 8502 TaxID=423474 RepID=T2I6J8_CROWT|nr:cobyrinate a,c-diamide synthase [Crocosphaera watsonii]CCQ48751.1 Cobyrinic acid A,C-diamide synthase [Crocosphaera watsonii WH 8502]
MTTIIAGDRSGTGKTTITLALLAFLRKKSAHVQSFKVGPDYIDSMFHSYITGRPCRNLDPILTSVSYVKSCFAKHCQGVDYGVIEGVMGLFDGVPLEKAGGTEGQEAGGATGGLYQDYGSTAHIARILGIPVVLVIDCSRLSGSVAAIAHGYSYLDPNINVVGVILNRVGSDRHLTLLETALKPLNIPIFGVIYRQETLTIPDRHLGLVPTQELPELDRLFDRLAHLAQTCFNWEQLLPYLTQSPSLPVPPSPRPPVPQSPKIAIAKDKAFNFYYPDNLEILQQLGAKLCYWSPLEDENLPKDTAGLYFGGGFPEMFTEALSSNTKALHSVKQGIIKGMPTYAECGGLMYLCEEIVDFEGKSWPMVGILPTTAKMVKKLTLGYRQAIATGSNFLLNQGETIWGHEFHRSELTILPEQPLYNLSSWQKNSLIYGEGWHCYHLHASYLHLHFGGCPQIAEKFFRSTLDFSRDLALD